MTNAKMTELVELKKLLDSEIITPEEFEQEKKKILSSDNQLAIGTPTPIHDENNRYVQTSSSDTKKRRAWVVFCFIAIIVVVIAIVSLTAGDHTTSEVSAPCDEMTETVEAVAASPDNEEIPIDEGSGVCPYDGVPDDECTIDNVYNTESYNPDSDANSWQ